MASSGIDPARYPSARRDESIVDDFHGLQVGSNQLPPYSPATSNHWPCLQKIVDSYRWLENPDSEETQAFVAELNKISEPYVQNCPLRQKLETKLTQLWDYEKFGCTSIHGPYFYYYHNSGLQNQWVLYQQSSLDDCPGKVFIDPNTLSADGTTSIRTSAWTVDGSVWAYGLSEKGSDWVTVRFKKSDGTDLPDELHKIKFSDLSWTGDNSGVFYSVSGGGGILPFNSFN